jgi:hypothetical protein
VKEFVDFLGGQPPFDALDADDLARLVSRAEVEYFPAGAVVLSDSEDRLSHLWVVRTGALEVLDRGRVVGPPRPRYPHPPTPARIIPCHRSRPGAGRSRLDEQDRPMRHFR